MVHKWRAAEQSILVGAGTVRADNPRLNVRYWNGNDPIRIILSRSGNLNDYLTKNETNGTVIVFTCNSKSYIGSGERITLKEDIASSLQVVDYLYNEKIQSLFIEGGAEILTHFIENGLWDEARIFTGLVDFNEGVKAPSISGRIWSDTGFEKSRLRVLLNE